MRQRSKWPDPDEAFRLFLLAYLGIRILLLAWSSQRVRFVMDEMAFLSQFPLFSGQLYRDLDPIKTVLAAYLFSVPRAFLADSAPLLLAARAVGFVLALVSVALAFVAAKRLYRDSTAGLAAAATLLSFTNFAERAFRIRADSVATLFAIAALCAALSSGRRSARAWVTGILAGAAFLSTQKAIYIALAFGCAFLLAGNESSPGWRTRTLSAARFSAGWGIALLGYGVAFGGTAFATVLAKVFVSPWEMAFSSPALYDGIGTYRILSLKQNPIIYLVCAAGLGLTVARWPRLDVPRRFAATSSVALVSLSFAHNQPWPYVFALPQVFLSIWSPELLRMSAAFPRQKRAFVIAGFAAVLALSLPRGVSYPLLHTNAGQLRVIAFAESLLSPTDRYFDGIGMLPMRPIAGRGFDWWWDRPGLLRFRESARRGNRPAIEDIMAGHPKLWILNYRVLGAWREVEEALRNSYARIAPEILLSGVVLPGGEPRPVPFNCRFPGEYRLFTLAGLPLDEGLRVDEGPETRMPILDVGIYHVRRLNPGEPALLLPKDARIPGSLPKPDAPISDLFSGVYDY